MLELTIVLVVLGVLMAMVWPSLRRPLAKGLVHEAARQLAKDLAESRMLAIDSGEMLTLRFEMEGSRYVISAADSVGDDEEGAELLESDSGLTGDLEGSDSDDVESVELTIDLSGSGSSTSASGDGTDFRNLVPAPLVGVLPNDVVFSDPLEVPGDESFDELFGDQLDLEETEEVETVLEKAEDGLSSISWSTPIMFYPTGRSDSAEFLLRDIDGYTVVVTLRGLTGAVSVGKVMAPPAGSDGPENINESTELDEPLDLTEPAESDGSLDPVDLPSSLE